MSTIEVYDNAAFATAIQTAQGGDTILMAPGAYTLLYLGNKNYAEDLTIRSMDARNPAQIDGLNITGSSGINISNVEFLVGPNNQRFYLNVISSSDIHFSGLTVHGSIDGDSTNDGQAFRFRGSSDVSIVGSEFFEATTGITHQDNNGLLIKGNIFHDIRIDGIAGGGSSAVTIEANVFRDFYPQGQVGGTGDHADAIQFWTTATTASARDIVVKDNTFIRGDGYYVQGVFMNDEVGNLPFINVQITGNLMVGGMYNGIRVANASGLTLSDNVVVGFPDRPSGIQVDKGSDVVLTGNSSTYINVSPVVGAVKGVTLFNNAITTLSQDNGAGLLQAWLVKHPFGLNVVGDDLSDRLLGGLSRDTLNGGAGDDLIAGDGGDDYLRGGDGSDSLAGGDGFDDLNGNAGDDTLAGGAGADWVVGGKDNDFLFGDAGADLVYGNLGADTLSGGDDADVVRGGQGNDVLLGGSGDDFLSGDLGDDTLTGGAGADVFHMSSGAGSDRVTDFNRAAGDRIQLDPGMTYTVADTSAGAVVTFNGGADRMLLVGVQASGLTDGWIFGA